MAKIVGTQRGVSGHVDCCDGAQLGGWVWNPADATERVRYFVHLDDARHGPFIADQPRSDLAAAGIGDGGYGFSLSLARLDEGFAWRRLSLEVDGALIGLRGPGPSLSGSLDSLSGETLVGWAQDQRAPTSSITCRLWIDEKDCGAVQANVERPDLRAARIGSGRHGYCIQLGPLLRQHALDTVVRLRLSVEPDGRPVPPFPLPYSRLASQVLDAFHADRGGLTAAAAKLSAVVATAGTAAPGARSRLDVAAEPARGWRPDLPVTAYLEHLAGKPGCPAGAGIATPEELLELLAWHLGPWQTGARESAPALGDGIVAFLNTPQSLPGTRGRSLSRLMFRHWVDVRADYDIFSEAGYFRFIADWVARFVHSGAGAPALLPDCVCDALNEAQPEFAELSWPLSRYAVERARQLQPDVDLHSAPARLAWLARFAFEQLSTPAGARRLPGYCLQALRTQVADRGALTAGQLLLAWSLQWLEATSDADRVLLRDGWVGDARARCAGLGAAHPARLLEPAPPAPAALSPTPTPASSGGITVIGSTESRSGLGTLARDSLRALTAAGIAYSEISFSPNDPAAPSAEPRQVSHAGAATSGPAINIVHIQPDNLPEAVDAYGRARWPAGYNIGSFAWELEQLPEAYALGCRMADEIWLTSEFSCRGFRAAVDVPVLSMGIAVEPPPAEPAFDRASLGFAPEEYLFCFVFDIFSWATRKNPLALVQAFQRAFDGVAQGIGLVLKVRNAQHAGSVGAEAARHWRAVLAAAAGDARIRIIDAEYSAAALSALMQACDCYASLHRAEGFGYTMAEALYWGKPVLATDYSGNLDFTTAETAFLVDARPVYVPLHGYTLYTPGMMWGEPNLEQAAQQMRLLASRPEEARRRAEAGRRLVLERYSVAALAARYSRRLQQIAARPAGA